MIRVLAREQWRFQRMYVVWAAAIVAAAVGFATFATLSAATQGALDRFATRITLNDAPFSSVVALSDSVPSLPDRDDFGIPMTSASMGSLVDAANQEGAQASAYLWVQGDIVPATGSDREAQYSDWPVIYTVWGDVDWDSILAEGSAPGPDGIVVPMSTARDRGVGVGDTVIIGHTVSSDPDTWELIPDATLTVSGLAYDVSLYGNGGPAYVNHDMFGALVTMFTAQQSPSDPWPLQATVSWRHTSGVLAAALGEGDANEPSTFGSSPALAWLLAGLFTMGAIVTAFSLGRAQAQARVRWIATARALGARRAHLVGVAGVEWGMLAGAGAAAGIATGWVAATVAHAERLSRLAAAPPVGVSTPGFVVALMVALAAVLAAAVVAVPTVLAVRTSPTAALASGPAADTVNVSRRVKFWPVAAVFVASWVGTAAMALAQSDRLFVWNVCCGLAATASGIAVLVEACRVAVRVAATSLARSHRPWAVHASITLSGHPQQTTALAIVQALVITGISGSIVTRELNTWSFGWYSPNPFSVAFWFEHLRGFLDAAIPAPLSTTTVVLLLVAAQALIIAIAASSRAVASPETTTAGALGLTARSQRLGNAAAHVLAQVHGACIGFLAGVVGIGGIWLVAVGYPGVAYREDDLVGTPLEQMPPRLLAIAIVTVLSLLIAAAVAAATALVGRLGERLTTRASATA